MEYEIPTADSQVLHVAAGPDGNVWFTETKGNRVGRITPAGGIREFDVPTAGSAPGGITAGPDGNLWFTESNDQANGKIGRITPNGDIEEFDVTTLGHPREITVGSDGNLWFTKLTTSGADAIDSMTTSGAMTESPITDAPGDITLGPDGHIWFSLSGATIASIPAVDRVSLFPIGRPVSPYGIATGPDGNCWFAEEDSGHIGRAAPDGTITEFRIPGSNANGARYITAGPDGNMWFTEIGSAGVLGRITPSGLITEFAVAGDGDLGDLTSGADGGIWFAEPTANKIGRFEPPPLTVILSGEQLGTVTSSGGEIDCGPTCSHRMGSGESITLSASVPSDGIFTGWYGGGCSGTGTCTVQSATTVTATFQRRHNIVFVTSTKLAPGNLNGLLGADAICRDSAAAGKLVGNYVAWLSTSTVNAKERLSGARGWMRPDGRPFADSIDDITNGRIYYPPSIDENGQAVDDVNVAEVATGTWIDGLRDPWNSGHCNDWTDPFAGTIEAGNPLGVAFLWTANLAQSCARPLRLYCFGVDDATALAPARVEGRVAFLTSDGLDASGGIAAGDVLCQNAADANGLAGSFRALLATTTSSAAGRFSTAGEPWVRPDGIPIAATPTALFDDTTLLTGFSQSADGAYYGALRAWTGAPTPTALATPTSNCSDWTDPANGYGMTTSTGTSSRVYFYSGQSVICPGRQPIHCLQE